MQLTIERLSPTATVPEKGTKGAACWDLRASETVFIAPGKVEKISIGWAFDIADGWEVVIRSRSGLASKGIIVANSPGTIDSDYTGEVFILLLNTTTEVFKVNAQDRIAQMTVAPTRSISFYEGAVQKKTERGSNGFGSTGTN